MTIFNKECVMFTSLVEKRRSIYAIGKNLCISRDDIEYMIKLITKHTPTAFNSQSPRVLVLFNEESDKFWEKTKNELSKIIPENKFKSTEEKVESFKNNCLQRKNPFLKYVGEDIAKH